jgi:hypothetical protein
MNEARRKELIEAHRQFRKYAFEQVYPHVDAYFRDAEQALDGVKVASDLASYDPTLLKHFSEK